MARAMATAVTLAAAMGVLTFAAPVHAQDAPEDPARFDVGAILAMTGSAPYYGQVMSRSARMAAEEINAEGGIGGVEINLIVEDHQSGRAREGVAAMNRLLSLHNTQAVLSSFSPPTLAIAPIADREGVFVINGGGVSSALIKASRYMVHNRMLTSALAAGVVVRAQELGCGRMAIVHWQTDAGDSARDIFREHGEEAGIEIAAVESVVQGVGNVDTQVAKIRASRPECVALGLFQPEVGLVVKRLRELGIDVPVIGVEWTGEDARIADRHGEGYEYINEVFLPTDDNPWSVEFYNAYVERFDQEPDIYAANYYEGMYVIAELIRRAREDGGDYWDGAKLYQKLEEDPIFPSVYAETMTFDLETGVAQKPVALFRVDANGEGQFQRYVDAE